VRKFAFNYPLLLLVLWTGLMLAGDFVVLDTSVRQFRSRAFASATGRIVQSALGKGSLMHRGVDFQYNFSVNGVDYTGHRYRYDDRNAAFEYSAATNAFPAWSERTVYYNPARPEDSLLDPGLDGCDLLLLLFALPFSIVTLALWAAFFRAKGESSGLAPAGGIRILQTPAETRARLAEFSPPAAGGFGLASAAFVCVFPVVSIGGFAPGLRLMSAVWIFVLAVGLASFSWALARNRAGNFDLRINPAAQTVTLPRTGGRSAPLTVPRREIVAVSLLRRVSKSPSGNHFSFVPALDRAAPNSEPAPMKLVTWGWSEARARAFSQWLSGQLQVRFKGVEEEDPPAVSKG
jgi:hypothetical protein